MLEWLACSWALTIYPMPISRLIVIEGIFVYMPFAYYLHNMEAFRTIVSALAAFL
jgi:hypothetical protein